MNKIIVSLLLYVMTTPAFAGGGSYTSQSINLLILLAIFFVLGKKNLPLLLQNRAEDIQYEIEKGQKDLQIVLAHKEDVMEQLNGLDAKIEMINKQNEEDIALIQAKFKTQLAEEKTRITETTERSIEDELNRAKAELQKETVDLAIEMATNLLREKITNDDQKRIANSFVQSIHKEEIKEGTNV